MKYPAFSREKLSMNRSTGCGLKLKKPEKIRLTSSMPEARKNIQALQTNKKVRTVAGILDIFKFNSLLHIRWTTTARPCNAPQIIIIQLAPCHRPLTRNVISRFKYVRSIPFRLPPMGM